MTAKRRAGATLLDLTQSNPTQVLSHYPHAAIADAYAKVRDFAYCPEPAGSWQAREAVSKYYAQRNVFVSAERILLTASTSEAYSILFKLFCDSGDEVLIPVPSYPLFEYLAALENVRTVPYRLCYDGSWHIDFAHLQSQISSRSKAIVLVNPNNPTGSFLKSFEAKTLFAMAEKLGLPLIADEVFTDYPVSKGGNRVTALVGDFPVLTFSLNGLSKSCGMPQMKLGWINMSGPGDDRERARQRLEVLQDTYLSVGTPVQSALPHLLAIGEEIRGKLLERIGTNWNTLGNELEGSPAHALQTEAGWSAIVRVPNTWTEEEWVLRLLREEDVLTQPGYFFDMPGEAYLVCSLITPPREFHEGVNRIKQLAQQCS